MSPRRSVGAPIAAALLAIVLPACGTPGGDTTRTEGGHDGAGDDSSGSVGGGTDEVDDGATSVADPSATTMAGSSDDGANLEDTGGGGGFIYGAPDGGGVALECDLFAQDCPDGEKCMPWANDGGGAWNATRCSPIADNPAQAGDACTVEGSGVSGIDNCEIGSMCWDVDPEDNVGTCVSLCQGDESNPICEDPASSCVIANGGAIVLCLPTCDPLLQDCAPGQACYAASESFVCAPDVSNPSGAYGDPCEFINACNPGLACVNPALFSDCDAGGCCTAYCDLSDAGADATCAALDPAQTCLPWYAPGEAPPGAESIGVCGIAG